MKKYLALMLLVASSHSFAFTESTEALLSILNGTYYGHDCKVSVTPTNNAVIVEMFKNDESAEFIVTKGSPFQYRPYGRFVSSFKINQGTVNYTEFAFVTTPTNYGRYAVIEKREVRNRTSKVTKIECEIIE